MTNDNNCPFCRPEEMKNNLPNDTPNGTPCRRDIYGDNVSFAVLTPEQYTAGHTILVLKKHKTDITDDLSDVDLSTFFNAVHTVAVQLKEFARNDYDEAPEKIYVCFLGDGVPHLHAHLIPRYPFTEQDEMIFREIFTCRNGKGWVENAIVTKDLGGFWYITEGEKHYKNTTFGKKPYPEKVIYFRLSAPLSAI